MRVIGGAWKGRRLQAPDGDDVRPTTDRVKEAIFNILGDAVPGATVLDLCCGAGGLGIEALSRGAARAVFVDQDPRALAAARDNLSRCGAEPERWRLVRANAVSWLGRTSTPGGPWLALADPPYAGTLAAELVALLGARAAAPGFLTAVIEHATGGLELPAVPCSVETRRYGGTAITVLRPVGDGGQEES